MTHPDNQLDADVRYWRQRCEEAEEDRHSLRQQLETLEADLKLYRQALTKAVAMPTGELPYTKGYYSVMLCGNVVVKERDR